MGEGLKVTIGARLNCPTCGAAPTLAAVQGILAQSTTMHGAPMLKCDRCGRVGHLPTWATWLEVAGRV